MEKTAESVLKSARENNEPVLVLRAKDALSLTALDKYIEKCKAHNTNESHIIGLAEIRYDFVCWREANNEMVKLPD